MFPHLLLFFLFFSLAQSNECEIAVPIGKWLKNHTDERCDSVKGHFILDSSANKLKIESLYSSFGSLKIIYGCLKVEGYTGSKNLTFLSNLEEIICDPKQAKASGITNVINVYDQNFNQFGLSSLRNVTGPGHIVLSFGADADFTMIPPPNVEGIHCFTKKEIFFFLYHPQFQGKLYHSCETDDPCFPQTLGGTPPRDEWFPDEIPWNCTIFHGNVRLYGPWSEDDKDLGKFEKIEVIIGWVTVKATLLSSLEFFKSLKHIYTYRYTTDPSAPGTIQRFNYAHNQFLFDFSIPSLLPRRKLYFVRGYDYRDEISTLKYYQKAYFLMETAHPCDNFTRFSNSCGEVNEYGENTLYATSSQAEKLAWKLTVFWTILGVPFAFRSMQILYFARFHAFMSTSRIIIGTIILVLSLIAWENCYAYQKCMEIQVSLVAEAYGHLIEYFVPTIGSASLLSSFAFKIMVVLVAMKHASLLGIVLCYLDLILFYLCEDQKWSRRFTRFVVIFTLIVTMLLYLQLEISVPIGEVNAALALYDAPTVTYWPLVINKAAAKNASITFNVSNRQIAAISDQYYDFTTIQGMENLLPDILGLAFQSYSLYCDVALVVVFAFFHILRYFSIIEMKDNFHILFFLYCQLSINRIRWWLFHDLLFWDYCNNLDYYKIFPNDNNFGYARIGLGKYEILIRTVIEKLPYFGFTLVSFYSWRFARYHSYLAPALKVRKEKFSKVQSDINKKLFEMKEKSAKQ